MRKPGGFLKVVVVIGALLCIQGTSFAVESRLLELRNKLFEEAKAIQFGMAASEDTAVMFSLWDSAMITITQLNAYFYMLGIFEDKGKEGGEVTYNYLSSWLQELKRSSQLTTRNYAAIAPETIKENRTRGHLERIKKFHQDVNTVVDAELAKIAALRKAAQKRK